MKIRSVFFLMLIILLSDQAFAKKPIRPNGYYITKSGDTIHGYLQNKESMYLIAKTIDGKRKKFTPSKIKGFKLASREYISLYLKEFKTNRFMAVRVKGYCTLYAYEDVEKYSLNGMGGIVGGMVEGGFKAGNSGLYIKKEDDENYYSVPHAHKPLRKFLIRHFEDNTELISNLEEVVKVEDVGRLVIGYNKWYMYQRKTE